MGNCKLAVTFYLIRINIGIGQNNWNTCEKIKKNLISKRLDHLWSERQLLFDMGLKNKDLKQSLLEFAPIPRAGTSRAHTICVEEETEHGLCSLKHSTKAQ